MPWENIFEGGSSERFAISVYKNGSFVAPEDYAFEGITFSLSADGEIVVECEAVTLLCEVVAIEDEDVAEPVQLDGVFADGPESNTATLIRSRGMEPERVEVEDPEGTVSFAPYDTLWRSVEVEAQGFM